MAAIFDLQSRTEIFQRIIHIFLYLHSHRVTIPLCMKGRRGSDGMEVGFTTTCAASDYHHYSCDFESRSWRGQLDTALNDKFCLSPVVFSTNIN